METGEGESMITNSPVYGLLSNLLKKSGAGGVAESNYTLLTVLAFWIYIRSLNNLPAVTFLW